MTLYAERDIEDLKARLSVADLAGGWVKLRRRRRPSPRGFTHVGPCPFCSASQKKSDSRFECNDASWGCAAGCGGGSIIQLWAKRHGLDPRKDFIAIVEQLGGVRTAALTPLVATREGRAAFARGVPRSPVPEDYAADTSLRDAWLAGWDKGKRQADYAAFARERERKRLHDHFWQKAQSWPGTPVAIYLLLRGLQVPPNAKLRYLADVPYFKTGDEREPEVLHRGPAMLAAIRDADGVFRGLHITWLDPIITQRERWTEETRDGVRVPTEDYLRAAKRKFKAEIVDPESGELLKAKKSRGSKQGGYIDLGGMRNDDGDVDFTRQFSGEGIESTLAVYTAMVKSSRDVRGIAWRCGIDLGNLCGSASATVVHPTLKDNSGRARRVPGAVPDMTSPAMPVISNCRDYVQIADGDSDAFTTRCAMTRGEARRAIEKIPVRTIWPPVGMDFNDWIMGATTAAWA